MSSSTLRITQALALSMMMTSQTDADQPPECASFTVNSSYGPEFTFHRFYDFRRGGELDSFPYPPPQRLTDHVRSSPFALSRTVKGRHLRDDWFVREWERHPAGPDLTAINYVPQQVTMNGHGHHHYLTLNTTRLDNATQQGGEIYFMPAKVSALSLRLSARVTGAPGAVAGFFTYANDTQETDIEVLTRDGGHAVRLSNQPSTDANSSFRLGMPGGASSADWAVYRLDWLPRRALSQWFVDGARLAATTTNVPREPSTVFIDIWGNDGPWSGKMAVGGQALLDIQWIEMAFNASLAPEERPADGVLCTIDRHVGRPVDVSSSASSEVVIGWAIGVWVCAVVTACLLM